MKKGEIICILDLVDSGDNMKASNLIFFSVFCIQINFGPIWIRIRGFTFSILRRNFLKLFLEENIFFNIFLTIRK